MLVSGRVMINPLIFFSFFRGYIVRTRILRDLKLKTIFFADFLGGPRGTDIATLLQM